MVKGLKLLASWSSVVKILMITVKRRTPQFLFDFSASFYPQCLSIVITFQNRQKVFYLFINNRSVECHALKQALDVVFAAQNTMSPFVMISLQVF